MEELLKNLKRQNWTKWFANPIPALGNQTPIEASQSEEGRRKIRELLSFYDSTRNSAGTGMAGALDANVPTAWALWKLGMGTGSAEDFKEEEGIFNSEGNSFGDLKATDRKPRHQKKLDKRKETMFVPRRCEMKGCDKVGDDVKLCTRCKLAYYCSKEHLTEDWSRHKKDCNHLKKLDIVIKRFDPAEELKKYPIGCFPLPKASSTNLKCFVCRSGAGEVEIGFTECCNAPVCDNEHEYETMSYSRDHCMRSHRSYTLCGYHHNEGHEGDWRSCSECRSDDKEDNGIKVRSWYATNGFNLTPGPNEVDMPQGSYITMACDACNGRILEGHEGHGSGPKGTLCMKFQVK